LPWATTFQLKMSLTVVQCRKQNNFKGRWGCSLM
jgi:hypothetical protein